MVIVSIILIIIAIYLAAGFVFAVAFIVKGVTKIDEGAHGATWGFRLIIIPGTIVFWPFLLNKWIRASKTKEE
ncbi:MAG: hypothetical protein Q8941_20325 [Bacteroidota bacterium]|nr:hypothetical protein [Bacteroidota bacterium]